MGSSTLDFDTMRTAERKRCRKRISNLETALRDHRSIATPIARTPSPIIIPRQAR